MVSKILVGVSAVVVFMVLFMAFFGASHIAHPKFIVVNKSSSPVALTVGWGGNDRPYGTVKPSQRVKFMVDAAETEMTLLAEYPDGNTVASQLLYLSSGEVTKANILETHIEFE